MGCSGDGGGMGEEVAILGGFVGDGEFAFLVAGEAEEVKDGLGGHVVFHEQEVDGDLWMGFAELAEMGGEFVGSVVVLGGEVAIGIDGEFEMKGVCRGVEVFEGGEFRWGVGIPGVLPAGIAAAGEFDEDAGVGIVAEFEELIGEAAGATDGEEFFDADVGEMAIEGELKGNGVFDEFGAVVGEPIGDGGIAFDVVGGDVAGGGGDGDGEGKGVRSEDDGFLGLAGGKEEAEEKENRETEEVVGGAVHGSAGRTGGNGARNRNGELSSTAGRWRGVVLTREAMSVLDFILESVVHELLLVFCYALGWVVLKVGSLGMLRLAPYSTMETERLGRRWYQWDFSLWIQVPRRGRCLRAGFVVLTGFLVPVGVIGYWVARSRGWLG